MFCLFFPTGNVNTHTATPVDYLATEPEDIGQDIVTLGDPQEEFSLGDVTQHTQNEAQGAVESFSLSSETTPVVADEQDPTPSPLDKVHTTTTKSKILTSTVTYGWEPESTQTSWQKVLNNPIDFVSVPENHLQPSHNRPMPVEDLNTENSTAHEVKTHNHKHYQPMPETNLEPGERVDYKIFIESKPKSTIDNLETAYEFREVGGSKHFQPMPETNLDDELCGGESCGKNLDHTTQTISTITSEGIEDEMTASSTERTSPVILNKEHSNENFSSESTTDSKQR